jgi:hypothetical protein
MIGKLEKMNFVEKLYFRSSNNKQKSELEKIKNSNVTRFLTVFSNLNSKNR